MHLMLNVLEKDDDVEVHKKGSIFFFFLACFFSLGSCVGRILAINPYERMVDDQQIQSLSMRNQQTTSLSIVIELESCGTFANNF